MAIEPDLDVEREVRTNTQEHSPALGIVQVEVIKVDVAAFDGGPSASGKVPGYAFGLARFQDDRDATASTQLLKKGFDQFFATVAFVGRDDVNAIGGSALLNKVVVVA